MALQLAAIFDELGENYLGICTICLYPNRVFADERRAPKTTKVP
jgi:hypothetical protein